MNTNLVNYRHLVETQDAKSFNKRLEPILVGVLANREPIIYYAIDNRISLADKENPLVLTADTYSLFNFSNCDLSYMQGIEKDFTGVSFDHSLLDFVNLKESDLTGASFRKARLNYTNLGLCNLAKSNFAEALIVKTIFSHKIELRHQGNIFQSFYKTANLEGAVFSGSTIVSIEFPAVKFENVDFSKATLHLLQFDNNFMYNTTLANSKVTQSHFNKMNGGNVKLNQAIVQDTTIENSSFQACDFDQTQFINVAFTSNEFLSSSFKNCLFQDCRFSSDTFMEDCDFSHSVFEKCSLYTENNFFKFSRFDNVSIRHSLIGANDHRVITSWVHSGSLENPRFETCELFLERESKIKEHLTEH